MKKIHSYTIIELIVVMIIISLIVSFTYVLYNKFQHIFNQIKDDYIKENDIELFYIYLKRDFNDAETVKFENSALLISKSDRHIIYSFNDSSIVKEINGLNDTLHLQIEDLNISTYNSSDLVNEITVTFKKNKILNQIHLFKEYPSITLIRKFGYTTNLNSEKWQ
jgi:prepilin-type N-terminal cleavage/methylation domain-containing protein